MERNRTGTKSAGSRPARTSLLYTAVLRLLKPQKRLPGEETPQTQHCQRPIAPAGGMVAFAFWCAKQTPSPAVPAAFRPAQGAPQLAAATVRAGGCCQPTASRRPAESQRGRVARGFLPAPGHSCAATGPRDACKVSTGLSDMSAPGRWGQRGLGLGPAEMRHGTAGKATIALSSPRQVGPAPRGPLSAQPPADGRRGGQGTSSA